MKRIRLLTVIPVCAMLLVMPVSGIRAGAVTVDIKDNYDAGLLKEESDSKKNNYTDGEAVTPPSEAASSASSSASSTSGSSSSNASSKASSAASSTAASTAASAASSAATTAATTAAATTNISTTQVATTDLPKTGDDNRIMITFIAMLASFSVFLTALVCGGHFGKGRR